MAYKRRKKKSTFERLTSGELNRQSRKQIALQLSGDSGLGAVHPHAAGIDVGNESHFVAVGPGKAAVRVREFGTWTAALQELVAWLIVCEITTVALQSTGVYWISLYDLLEKAGIEVFLVNARHTKNVPGRKSDVQECEWLRRLHTYGLLRNSFRPPEHIRPLRTVWRLRSRHVEEAGRCVQHMQKALTQMNVHLANAISDISGVTGQAIIGAILDGERDPYRLAALRDRRIAASEEEVARSLEGVWQEDLVFELRQAVEAYRFQHQQILACDKELQKYLAQMPDRTIEAPDGRSDGDDEEPTGTRSAADTEGGKKGKKKRKNKRPSQNAPKSFDLMAELTRVCGADGTSIPGVQVMTMQTIVAELGPDLKRWWPTENHFTSWLRLSPQQDISGGKVIRHTREQSRNRVAMMLRMGASTLLRSDSYLGARYRSLRFRLGPAKAIKAMARYLACLIYRLLTQGRKWVDRGAEMYEQQRHQRELSALQHKAGSMGFQLVEKAAA